MTKIEKSRMFQSELLHIVRSRIATATLIALALVGSVMGVPLGVVNAATQQQTQSARVFAAIDPSTLVSVTEASEILGKTTTVQHALGSAQCLYKPEPAAVFEFQEPDRIARIRIDYVTLTVITGSQAMSSYSSKQAIFGRDRDDEEISGLGDKAIFTRGSELSVLQGSNFINVSTQGDTDWGSGSTRYEDVHAKYVGILQAFARLALQRLTAQESPATTVPVQPQVQAAPETRPPDQTARERSPLGLAVGIAIAGLGGVLTAVALALRNTPRARTLRRINALIAEYHKEAWGVKAHDYLMRDWVVPSEQKPEANQNVPFVSVDKPSHEDKFDIELEALHELQLARERVTAGLPPFEIPTNIPDIDREIIRIGMIDGMQTNEALNWKLDKLQRERDRMQRDIDRGIETPTKPDVDRGVEQPSLPNDETFTPPSKKNNLDVM